MNTPKHKKNPKKIVQLLAGESFPASKLSSIEWVTIILKAIRRLQPFLGSFTLFLPLHEPLWYLPRGGAGGGWFRHQEQGQGDKRRWVCGPDLPSNIKLSIKALVLLTVWEKREDMPGTYRYAREILLTVGGSLLERVTTWDPERSHVVSSYKLQLFRVPAMRKLFDEKPSTAYEMLVNLSDMAEVNARDKYSLADRAAAHAEFVRGIRRQIHYDT